MNPRHSSILAYFHFFSKFIPFDNGDVKELCEKVRKCGYTKSLKTYRLEVQSLDLGLFEAKKFANIFKFLCKPIGLRTLS